MKKISVIIPCYNVGNLLDRCVDSLLAQTMDIKDMEIIPVDDASTDDTADVIRSLQEKYPSLIKGVFSSVNGRQGRARNMGLSEAEGEWIAYVDADDLVERDYLLKLLEAGEKYDCDLVCCRLKEDRSRGIEYFSERKTGKGDMLVTLDTEEKRKEISISALIEPYPVGKLVKRSLLLENRLFFPERLSYEDTWWGNLLCFYVKRFYILEEYLYHYYVNENSTILSESSSHHIDSLTVHMMLWDAYVSRGLAETYGEELAYNFLYTCYLGFLKILALRYKEPSYSQFLLMKQIVRDRVPDWRNNLYIRQGRIGELHRSLLEFLDLDADRASFRKLMETVRNSGM